MLITLFILSNKLKLRYYQKYKLKAKQLFLLDLLIFKLFWCPKQSECIVVIMVNKLS
ncbi:hypothetical protein NUSPORA_00701 [Nucleospora cyclopteri]